ncbi:MAG: Na+/H+ antiporter [Armatimonas sp.]
MPSFEIVLGLLAVIAVLAAVGRKISLPDPIVFALGGVVLAILPGIPRIAMSPAVVLTVFLPPLIYAAAQDTTWSEIKEHARPILLLAVGLVLVTMGAVALVTHALVPSFSWAAALTLGAIVGPPDAVAAKAISDTLHLPRRLVAVLEGEGLINDATALVAFQIASASVMTGDGFHIGQSAYRLCYAAVMALGVGFIVSLFGLKIIRKLSDPVTENTILLLLPFFTYLLAEHVHASGVLAVLVLALQVNQYGNKSMSSKGRLVGRAVWEMIDFLLTGLSFVLVGLQLRSVVIGLASYSVRQVGIVSIAVCLTVILVRPLWVFGVAALLRRFNMGVRHGESPSTVTRSGLLIVSWAGMRGVVSLAIALSLPQMLENGQPFLERDLIVFITFAVILVTLIGQGLSLPALIRRLGMASDKSDGVERELAARLSIAEAARDYLEAITSEGKYPDAVVKAVLSSYNSRISRLEELQSEEESDDESFKSLLPEIQELRSHLLKFEQRELQRMRDAGEIDPPMARKLQQDVDVSQVRTKHLT